MKKISPYIFLFISLVLVLTYFLPIWSISLDAPQYPEGIGLYIWLYTIEGHHPHDLDNINGLNHYIGMKKIVPDSIPELQFMPYIVGFMIIFALIIYFVNKKWMAWIWVILFIVIMIVGLYDYYIWGYDYGHDLNPHAAIKVPGMSYQPPLIGTKQLLNFTSTSWPAAGGIIIGFSILFAIAAIFLDSNKKKND
jgi:copper chaperone NosL